MTNKPKALASSLPSYVNLFLGSPWFALFYLLCIALMLFYVHYSFIFLGRKFQIIRLLPIKKSNNISIELKKIHLLYNRLFYNKARDIMTNLVQNNDKKKDS